MYWPYSGSQKAWRSLRSSTDHSFCENSCKCCCIDFSRKPFSRLKTRLAWTYRSHENFNGEIGTSGMITISALFDHQDHQMIINYHFLKPSNYYQSLVIHSKGQSGGCMSILWWIPTRASQNVLRH